MTTFRTSDSDLTAADPGTAPQVVEQATAPRAPAPRPARRPLTAAQADDPVPPPAAPEPPADPLAARLQARLEALDSQPGAGGPDLRPRRTAGERRSEPPGEAASDDVLRAGIEDLNQQLEVLRGQLEAAFDDVDARVAAAHAEARAAQAQLADVVAAVDQLALELPLLVGGADEDDLTELRAALNRLKARLHPR